ncbi:dihydrofolate reductase family protein [Streptomyces sp. NPDC058424]|uniref:dihydrofolate reductase family protein n=1 Tax=Streptomyces sp. NPDC058424 TaxID=3346491 RepID=UPI00364CA7A0
MDRITGASSRPGLIEEYAETTGAVRGGRDGFNVHPDVSGIYGGAWQGPVFVLTHHPEDARPATGVTFLSCDVAEAVRIGLEAAGGKNLEVFSPTIGRQLLERGLIDEIDLCISHRCCSATESACSTTPAAPPSDSNCSTGTTTRPQ